MATLSPYIVFGYGSLIFKPPPHVVAQAPGYLKGYVRRFAQRSHDHRGTPEAPGRVPTLIHKEHWESFSGADPFPEEDVVWGMTFTIDPLHAAEVRAYLDHREKDGYTVELVDVYNTVDGHERVILSQVMTYVGLPNNPSFMANESIEDISQVIWKSVGPSGSNKDYFYALSESVRHLAPNSHDSHLFAIETRIRQLDEERLGKGLPSIANGTPQ